MQLESNAINIAVNDTWWVAGEAPAELRASLLPHEHDLGDNASIVYEDSRETSNLDEAAKQAATAVHEKRTSKLRWIENALLLDIGLYFVLYVVTSGSSSIYLWFPLEITLLSITVVLFTAFVLVGGPGNVDRRIANRSLGTWSCYVVAIAVLINGVVDYRIYMQCKELGLAGVVNTLYAILWTFALLSMDSFVSLSRRFVFIVGFLYAFVSTLNLLRQVIAPDDTPLWGTTVAQVKITIFTQSLTASARTIKRVALDPGRAYLHFPTSHWRRVPVKFNAVRKSEIILLVTMCASAVGYWFALNGRFPFWIVQALYTMDAALIMRLYWGNTDWWICIGLVCSYEVVLILLSTVAALSLTWSFKWNADTDNEINSGHESFDIIAAGGFTILYVLTDSLQNRSLVFRRATFILFLVLIGYNLAMTAGAPHQEFGESGISGFLGRFMTKNSVLTTAYLQIITVALPGTVCVFFDRDQSKIPFVRVKMLRPPPLAPTQGTTTIEDMIGSLSALFPQVGTEDGISCALETERREAALRPL